MRWLGYASSAWYVWSVYARAARDGKLEMRELVQLAVAVRDRLGVDLAIAPEVTAVCRSPERRDSAIEMLGQQVVEMLERA